jgi:hypothetical protein
MTFRSFWGVFGWMNVFLDSRIYSVILATLILAVGGLVTGAYRAVREGGNALWRQGRTWAWLSLALLLPIVIAASAWTSLYQDPQPQGRYLYAGLVPVVLLTAAGLHQISSAKLYQRAVTAWVGGGMILLNGYSLLFVLAPAY